MGRAHRKYPNGQVWGPHLRLGLLSTLIRHESEDFGKRSQNRRRLKTDAGFSFSGGWNAFWKRSTKSDGTTVILWFPWPSVPQTQVQTDRLVIVAFFNFSGVLWTETEQLKRFRSETSFFISLQRSICIVRADQRWEIYLHLLVHRGCKAMTQMQTASHCTVLRWQEMLHCPNHYCDDRRIYRSIVEHFSGYFSHSDHIVFSRSPLVN